MCVYVLYMHVCVVAFTCMFGDERLLRVSFSSHFTLLLGTSSLTDPGAPILARLVAQKISYLIPSTQFCHYQTCVATPSVLVGPGNLNQVFVFA